jgi:hypothetical protein
MISLLARLQLCGISLSKGIINPVITQQTTIATGNGQRIYYKFYAKKNCSYIFKTCGLTNIDTELEILSDTTFIPKLYNDDFCSYQSYVNWICDKDGWYIIYLTRFGGTTCKTLTANVSVTYWKDCPIVLGYIPGGSDSIVEEDNEIIPALSDNEIIVRLFDLTGREVELSERGILIAEFADRTRRIIKIK